MFGLAFQISTIQPAITEMGVKLPKIKTQHHKALVDEYSRREIAEEIKILRQLNYERRDFPCSPFLLGTTSHPDHPRAVTTKYLCF